MTANLVNPVLRQADDAEVLGAGSNEVRLLLDASATDSAISLQEVRLADGADGAQPHFHTRSHELFYVVEGELQVLLDDTITTLAAGGALVVPKRLPHAFGATPGISTRLLVTLTPGVERFEYFRLLARIERGEATVQNLLDSQETYDTYFVDSPRWRAERAAGHVR
ncbi:cupin domain-containing protein [Nocardia macrotermitis]|uniref:Cupin type-2 domain-containing protein n=1 Tax=Nocardia macrotermitis TaxID=2585198 RepID=A0A7K0D959_9NOCA|nr:cupin domain-containing protein [Nocardia macrotermitis]MQY22306.1 hypothetical protein [Nocardia macrotermitis]